MSDFCRLIWCALIELFRPLSLLEAEILVLCHQLNILRWKSPKRRAFRSIDQLVFAGLYGLMPNIETGKRVRRRYTQLQCVCRVSFLLDVGGVLTPLLRVPGAH
jgi:hypothetical protein